MEKSESKDIEEILIKFNPSYFIDSNIEGMHQTYEECPGFGKSSSYCPKRNKEKECEKMCNYSRLAHILFHSGRTLIEPKR